ncbi:MULTISPECIES: site-specific integrase [Streptomyces]|uniref:Tyr recombinase domain-containing protein n=1 Tax=Streptomyces sp. NBC_00049 TaxID=2903617 RepID=A0AAU2JY44_9ACTN|nr:hypothetical protein [Streptomyces sp. NBC_00160]MCX5303038.1 hypothetical protein [Streptomyces sp. NBC_00160]
MQLYAVDTAVVRRYLDNPVLTGDQAARLLELRGISDGTPIYLDAETMMPVEPLCSWGRNMSYADLAGSTLKDYGRIMARFSAHQATRVSDVLSATESDLVAYKKQRTQLQKKPVGTSVWSKESSVLDQFFTFAVEQRYLRRRPMRVAARGRNALSPRTRRGMDIRHLSLGQYRYFRDVGLGGQCPDSRLSRSYRGSSPHRDRAGADLALCSGMRWQEWATVLLPELGLGVGQCAEGAEFTVQACAKYGKERGVFVPEQAMRAVETYCLLERKEFTAAAARRLERLHRELFVVSRVEAETGRIHGTLDGTAQVFSMQAMPPRLRRITVWEGEFGLEAMAVFLCRGGLMPGADSWKRYRHAAWRRMVALADETTPRLPAKRWRWHDLRHTYALQLLTYLEQQMDGAEPDMVARRRRHRSYLSGHIRYNPLLIVSRRLGHSSPETTYAYLEYTDDLVQEYEAAFAGWVGDPGEEATYAQIAARAFRLEKSPVGVG